MQISVYTTFTEPPTPYTLNIFFQKHDNSILTVKNKLKLTDTAAVTVAENNFTTFTVSTTWLGKHGYILSAVFNNQILWCAQWENITNYTVHHAQLEVPNLVVLPRSLVYR